MQLPPVSGRINLVAFGIFILFLALKLTGEVGWSWWIIFSPLFVWICVAVFWRDA